MTKSGTTIHFKYDHNGLRVGKVVNGTKTKYMFHGKLVTHLTVGSDSLHFFYDTQSRPAKVSFNGTVYTYIHNLQGDIVGILDSSGNLVVEYKYDAWGKPIATTGSLAATLGTRNPFRYRGYIYDEETELYYLRSRYYNPVVGRFVNADTQMGWTSLMGKNMYLYCMNAPSLLSDSNGFSPVIEPRPSRPENWDADYRAEFRRERMQALVRKAAKAVMQAVRNVNLYRMVLQLANHGGGVIKFKSGSKATCYTRTCSHYLQ